MQSVKAILIALVATLGVTSASVALPGLEATSLASMSQRPSYGSHDDFSRQNNRLAFTHNNMPVAMAIPGYGVTEQIFVGGFSNFLQIYNFVITARVLLSWFPQAQSIGALQPVFQITDPYLNLFRGIIPPIFGLDLSPILAFFTLNVLTTTTASIGCEIPEGMKQKMNKTRFGKSSRKSFVMN